MRLGVNIDHIATVRQARGGSIPDPLEAARVCEQAGADGIVCHLREDRRHIQDDDVKRLRAQVKRLNVELSIDEDVVETVLRIRPHSVTFVPERRQELTTEGGLDVRGTARRLARLVSTFQNRGVAVSLFVDPVPEQLEVCAEVGARIVELHTGRYATATRSDDRLRYLKTIQHATAYARRLGLTVAAGHGLDYENVQSIRAIHHIEELNIGFSIVSRALSVGLEQAVREMKALLR